MKTYKMNVRSLKTKYEYTVYGDNGEAIDTRKSERSYTAATVSHIKREGRDIYKVNYHGKAQDAGETSDAIRYRKAGYDVGVAYLTLQTNPTDNG